MRDPHATGTSVGTTGPDVTPGASRTDAANLRRALAEIKSDNPSFEFFKTAKELYDIWPGLGRRENSSEINPAATRLAMRDPDLKTDEEIDAARVDIYAYLMVIGQVLKVLRWRAEEIVNAVGDIYARQGTLPSGI